jgi:hypothetical protein
MSAVSCTVRLEEESRIVGCGDRGHDGRVIAWLDLDAAGQVSVFGSPHTMRRLAAAALNAAEEGDRLGAGRVQQASPAPADDPPVATRIAHKVRAA